MYVDMQINIRVMANSTLPEGPDIPNMLISQDVSPNEDKATSLDMVNPLSLRSGTIWETSGNATSPSI